MLVTKAFFSRGVKSRDCVGKELTVYHTISTVNSLEKKKAFENIVGKRRKCIFSFSPQCFLPFPPKNSISQTYLSSANAFNLDQSKIFSFGKELNPVLHNLVCKQSWVRSLLKKTFLEKEKMLVSCMLHPACIQHINIDETNTTNLPVSYLK